MTPDVRVEVRGTPRVEVRAGLPGRPQNNINIKLQTTAPDSPQALDLWVNISQ